MPQATGSQLRVVGFDEDAFNTMPGTPQGRVLYVNSLGLGMSMGLVQSKALGNGSRAQQKPGQGNRAVAGPAQVEMAPNTLGWWLKHILGGYNKSGAGPYTHSFSIGDLPPGMLVERDWGANIPGIGRYTLFSGCRVASAEFQFHQEEAQILALQLMGADEKLDSAAIVDADGVDDFGHVPFYGRHLYLSEGGSPIAIVTDCKVKMDNQLDGDNYTMRPQGDSNSHGVRRSLTAGQSVWTGEITALFESPALYQKAINGTESSLGIELIHGNGGGTAGNEKFTLTLPKLQYGANPLGVDGPKGIRVTLPFTCYEGVTAELVNSIETL
jgi:hypothetical protein